MNIKPDDHEITIAGVTIQPVSELGKARLLAKLYEPWADACPACGAIGLHMCEVSPWRSLTNDPPEPPTETTNHALLVRDMRRDLADDRYRLLVPYNDRDNGGVLRWFESHLDYVLEDVIESGYAEWMEVPK